MYISYIPKRSVVDVENGSYFSWEGNDQLPTSATYATGIKHTFTTARVINNVRIRAQLEGAGDGSHFGLNGGDFGVLGTGTGGNEVRFYEFTGDLINGINELSFWSTNLDVAHKKLIEVVKGGELECGVQPYARDQGLEGKQSRSLSGIPYSTLYRNKREHPIVTVPIDVSNPIMLDQWWEFADSVAASESFWFDALGSKAAPKKLVQAFIKQGSFKEEWVGPTYRRFRFTAIEL